MNSVMNKSMFYAKIIMSDLKNVTRVSVPKYVMDERLTMYFKEKFLYYVEDPFKCNQGDYVIIQEFHESVNKNITHKVKQVVYQQGNYIDPLTGKRCAGTEYIDDIKKTCDLFNVERPYFKK